MKLLPEATLMLVLMGTTGCRAVLERHPRARYLTHPNRNDDLPFSDLVLDGDTAFVSGTLGIDARTGEPPDDPEAEIRMMLDAFRNKLALAGMTMDDLVWVQVYATDLGSYALFNDIYRSYFARRSLPVRAFVGAASLLRGARFEILGIAVQQAGR